jgi:hypothetical protein
MHFDADRLGRSDEFWRIVDANDLGASLDDLVRQGAIAAAHVQDPLADFGVKQIEGGLAKVGNEASDPGIVRGVPTAGRGDREGQSVFTQSR